MHENRYDVAVIGGGPAGSLSALRLARLGWRVLLADDSPPKLPTQPIPEMLAPEGVWLLERLGLSTALDAQGSGPCHGILSYWDPDQVQFADLALTRLRPGWIVDRRHFDAGLRECAAGGGVEIRHSTRIRFMGLRGDAPARLRMEPMAGGEGTEVTAAFVVEATGRRPARGVAADESARRLCLDRLVALPVHAQTAARNDGILRIAPSRSGWWYTVAFEGIETVAVYLTDGDLLPRAPTTLAHHLERERNEVQDLIGLISTDEMGPRGRMFRDARTGCRRALWREQWLTVGDAAFTLDPLSGSGLTRGLQMADQAASAIHHFLATGERSELLRFAVSCCADFSAARAVGQRLYAHCARRFPESEFWRRRGRAQAPGAAGA